MIRNATVDDAGAIARIHVQTWRQAYHGVVPAEYLASLSVEQRTGFWRQHISGGHGVVLVALDGEEIVGWVSGGQSPSIGATPTGEIYAIYIAPAFWRRGVGRQLMQAIEKALPGPVVLWVLRENRPAITFYGELGYRHDGGEKNADFGSVTLSEIRFSKNETGKRTPGSSGVSELRV